MPSSHSLIAHAKTGLLCLAASLSILGGPAASQPTIGERAARAESPVRVCPGDERAIGRELCRGRSVDLVPGATYVLDSTEAIRITASHVALDGQGATLVLDETFSNRKYAPRQLHGDVHRVADVGPLATAFGVYIGKNVHDASIRNLRIVRRPVDGSVVRSISVVKSARVRLQNVEMTGPTIGPIVDIVDSTDVALENCRIVDSHADNQSRTLDRTGAGKPNLTGVLIDDVDLLTAVQREMEELHSERVRIIGCEIRNLTMDPSVAIRQTDGVNIQRGKDYVVSNCRIVNCDEGIDTFACRGVIARNSIELDAYDEEASAGVKLVHGAHHNLVIENRFVNRRIGVILAESPLPSLDWSNGVMHNVIVNNVACGVGEPLWRISTSVKGLNPTANTLVGNRGARYSSDYTGHEPNHIGADGALFAAVGDFNADGLGDALVYEKSGIAKVYASRESDSPWIVTEDRSLIGGIADAADLKIADVDGDGDDDAAFCVGRNPQVRRLFLADPARRGFAYGGESQAVCDLHR